MYRPKAEDAPQPSSAPLPLTVGVELEFIFRFTTPSGESYDTKNAWLHNKSDDADKPETLHRKVYVDAMSPTLPTFEDAFVVEECSDAKSPSSIHTEDSRP
jgi:hypothetical protein